MTFTKEMPGGSGCYVIPDISNLINIPKIQKKQNK